MGDYSTNLIGTYFKLNKDHANTKKSDIPSDFIVVGVKVLFSFYLELTKSSYSSEDPIKNTGIVVDLYFVNTKRVESVEHSVFLKCAKENEYFIDYEKSNLYKLKYNNSIRDSQWWISKE